MKSISLDITKAAQATTSSDGFTFRRQSLQNSLPNSRALPTLFAKSARLLL